MLSPFTTVQMCLGASALESPPVDEDDVEDLFARDDFRVSGRDPRLDDRDRKIIKFPLLREKRVFELPRIGDADWDRGRDAGRSDSQRLGDRLNVIFVEPGLPFQEPVKVGIIDLDRSGEIRAGPSPRFQGLQYVFPVTVEHHLNHR
jgi:hypothetical protein